MTQEEEKLLLLKDLCARLPYGVIVHIHDINVDDYDRQLIGEDLDFIELDRRNCKPYLRSISSMTEEERKELSQISEEYLDDWSTADSNLLKWKLDAKVSSMRAAFYNSHYLDWNDLISKGLALEAPPEMYNEGESEKGNDIPVPKTVDEAISTLEKILSDEDRDYLLENGAISMHDSLGRWIRNEWGLWTGSELKDELMNMNKGLNHPDDMSNYIIEEFIKYWNNKK